MANFELWLNLLVEHLMLFEAPVLSAWANAERLSYRLHIVLSMTPTKNKKNTIREYLIHLIFFKQHTSYSELNG
jgi:hypothetical protein